MFGGGSSSSSKPTDKTELKTKAIVARSQLLRANSTLIPESAFKMRRSYLVDKDTGVLNQKPEGRSMQEAMLTNPDMMTGMLKQQLSAIVPQMLMGFVVSFFFSGFILGKIPFALSPRFRVMLQRGIDLPSLDPSYFTSLSFYILLLFGLRGVLILLFKDQAINDMAAMQQMQMQMGMGAMQFDAPKAYEAEKKAVELLRHRWQGERVEMRVLRMLRTQIGHN